jgi:hypothetical protein
MKKRELQAKIEWLTVGRRLREETIEGLRSRAEHDAIVKNELAEAASSAEAEVERLRTALREIVAYVDQAQGNSTPNPDHMQRIARRTLKEVKSV